VSDEEIIQVIRDGFRGRIALTEERLIMFLMLKQYELLESIYNRIASIKTDVEAIRIEQEP
jgi:hypothetical protein